MSIGRRLSLVKVSSFVGLFCCGCFSDWVFLYYFSVLCCFYWVDSMFWVVSCFAQNA